MRQLLEKEKENSYQKFITKCDRLLWQYMSGITKCDRLLLLSAASITNCGSSQQTFQRRINVEITLIRRWKWSKIRRCTTLWQMMLKCQGQTFQRCTALMQSQCPTLKQRWENTEQCWYNVVSNLLQRRLNVS